MFKNMRTRLSALGLMIVGAMLMAVPAFASPPTIESVVDGAFDDVTSLLTGTLAAAFFAITLIVLGIVVGWKWLRRGAKQG